MDHGEKMDRAREAIARSRETLRRTREAIDRMKRESAEALGRKEDREAEASHAGQEPVAWDRPLRPRR